MTSIDGDLLRATADRQAITDLIYRYCRSMDRMDRAVGYSIFHDDAVADYGPQVYQGSGRGFIDFTCDQHRHLLHHSHNVTNIIIELDGDRAGSESYAMTALRGERDGRIFQISVWSRYIDTWSRRDGRWGIDRRIGLIDFDEQREVTPMRAASEGRRDRDDPSYAVLKGSSVSA